MLVLGIGFLLLVSLVLSAVITAMGDYLALYQPFSPFFLQTINTGVLLFFVALLFAMIFKILPNVHIAWRDVWVGALVTAVLFTLGKYLIGLYLGRSAVTSSYGAEFTYEFAQRRGTCAPKSG